MGLIHVRVDDRLVHGIVATSWIATWNPNRIICIDKQAAENQVMKSALRIATPSTIALSVLPYDKAKENILSGKYEDNKYVIIARNPITVCQLIEDGVKIPEVTMGIVCSAQDRKTINRTISLNDDEINAVKKMMSEGVKVVYRFRPDDIAVDFDSLLK